MDERIVEKIRLGNFRCHENYSLDCNKHTTLILGENGCGKTSVLEGVYIALQGRSFRATDRDIVRREAEYYRVEILRNDGAETKVVYDTNVLKKSFLCGDKKFARLPKKYKYPVVLFLPEDLHLVGSSPTKKRDYFDRILAQLDERYYNSFLKYNKALKQRNELLKQENVTQDMLFSWDVLMSKYGVEIRKKRSELTEEINRRITEVYRSIAKNNDKVELKYESFTAEVEESEYLRLLEMDFGRDKVTGHTNFGVHKDNYEVEFNQKPADGSASRGEVRSVVLALKFIEADLVFEKLGKKPLVLLDDVFSELDKTRQESLVTNFKNHQVILTSVDGVGL